MIRNLITKIIIPTLVFSLVLIFNSCEGNFLGEMLGLGSGFESQNNCAVQRQGQRKLLQSSKDSILNQSRMDVFAQGKVVLGQFKYSPGGQLQKVSSGPSTIPAGTQLAAKINNACLQANAGTQLSQLIVGDQVPMQGLENQTYSFTTNLEESIEELEAQAAADECIIGISYNQNYELSQFNDPNGYLQEHLAHINMVSSMNFFYDATHGMPVGRADNDVVIAIIDTGVDNDHEDLQEVFQQHAFGIGIDATTIGTANVNYNSNDISTNGHGTHVAGLAAAAGNNSRGVIGIMPFSVKLMPVRVFRWVQDNDGNDVLGGATTSVITNAIDYAVLNDADVVNLSLGQLTADHVVDALYVDTIQDAIDNDVFVVAAIGNSTSQFNAQEVDLVNLSSIPAVYAADMAGFISVGSVSANDGVYSGFAHYSNRYVEIAAPGAETGSTGLYSTVPVPNTFHQNSRYGRLSGTSMAAPVVSGAAALTIGIYLNTFGDKPAATVVEDILKSGSDSPSHLQSFVKDSKTLNLETLAQEIQNRYPETIGQSASLSSVGCN